MTSHVIPKRYLCTVLDELRTQGDLMDKLVQDTSSIDRYVFSSLVEEVQTFANRMESGLDRSNAVGRKIRGIIEGKGTQKFKLDSILALVNERWDFDGRYDNYYF